MADIKDRLYKEGFDEVFSAGIKAIQLCSFDIVNTDPDEGTIHATADTSLRSWGEDITVVITPTDEGTLVKVRSSVSMQLFDWGKSDDNIRRILFKMDILLE